MNEQLFNKLKNVVKDKGGQQYIEHEDEDGNLYLVGAEDDDDQDEDEDDDYQYDNDMIGGGHQIIDGDLDDEEFMEMMERNGHY